MNIKKYFNLKIIVGLMAVIIGIVLGYLHYITMVALICSLDDPYCHYFLPVWLVFSIVPLIVLGLIILIWGILEKIMKRMGKNTKILNIIVIIVLILSMVGIGIIFTFSNPNNNDQNIPIESRLKCPATGKTQNEFWNLNREFKEDPNQNAIGFNIETKNIRDNLYEKKISLDIFKGCEIISDEYGYRYKFIEILGFDDFNADSYPVLPVLDLDMELPEDSVIQEVRIQGTLPTEIKNIRLPAFNDYPPVMGGKAEPMYKDVDKNQYFDPISNPLWFESDSFGHKNIHLKLIPVIYDSETKTATIYSKIEASIVYETSKTGILHDISAEGNTNFGYFHINDTMLAVLILENTTNETQEYVVKTKLVDILGRPLKELSENISIKPNKRVRKEIDMGKIAEMNFESDIRFPTALFLEIDVFDSGNKRFGHQQKQLSIHNEK